MNITVNGESIPQEAYDRELQNVLREDPEAGDREASDRAKQTLIEQALIRQEAARQFPVVSKTEVDLAFEDILKHHGGAEQFYKRYNLTKQDDDAVKHDLEENIRITKFFEKLTADVPEPSDEDVNAYYEEHAAEEFMTLEEVHAAHIVKPVNPMYPMETYREMVGIREKLLDGADFAQVADECSSCDDTGGDLGFFPRGKMVEAFDVIVFSLRPGEISPVFQTDFGYHIATVYDKKAPEKRPLADVQDDIKKNLHYDRKNDYIGEWVDGRKKTAEIKVKEK